MLLDVIEGPYKVDRGNSTCYCRLFLHRSASIMAALSSASVACHHLHAIVASSRRELSAVESRAGLRTPVQYAMKPLKLPIRRGCGGRMLCASASPSASFSSESPSPVGEEEIKEDVTAEGRPVSRLSQADFVKEAVRRLSQEDLEVAVRKYNLEDELFAEVDYAQVNAFTDRAFSGNPAAVCYLPYANDSRWLQLIAREFNLSETAFVVKRQGSGAVEEEEEEEEEEDEEEPVAPEEIIDFDLRWFTPRVEVDLCGHATLASAHLLFASGVVEGDLIRFHTRSGILQARKVQGYDESVEEGKKRPSGKGVVELDFPISTATQIVGEQVQKLATGLGLQQQQVVWAGATSLGDFLLELESWEHVEEVKPVLHLLDDLPGRGGVIVTSRAKPGSGYHIVSRFFCPKAGVAEDPVTGSAHCTLGWYWSSKLGTNSLEAYQASERGGSVSVRVDEQAGRVFLQGAAVLVMAGVILNPVTPTLGPSKTDDNVSPVAK